MILNYLLPSSLVYKVIKPESQEYGSNHFYNKTNNNVFYEKGLFEELNGFKRTDIGMYAGYSYNTKKEFLFEPFNPNETPAMYNGAIFFGGFRNDIPSIQSQTDRKSIELDNIKYMNLIHSHINKHEEKIKLQGFSNGCNDLMMFLEFLQEHANDLNSLHRHQAKEILNSISDIELNSPYQNFATSISCYLSDAVSNQGTIGRLLVGLGVLLSPILLPIIGICGLISKIIDISRGVDNSKVLSDEHLYHRFGGILQKNSNIKGDIKYSVNDPMVGDFGIAEKDQSSNYRIKSEFQRCDNIKISVSEKVNHYNIRDDYKTISNSKKENIKIVSKKEINANPFKDNVIHIKEKNKEEKDNNLSNYTSPYDTIYYSCDNRDLSQRSETEYYTCKGKNENLEENNSFRSLR
jgi:hypothetical protein